MDEHKEYVKQLVGYATTLTLSLNDVYRKRCKAVTIGGIVAYAESVLSLYQIILPRYRTSRMKELREMVLKLLTEVRETVLEYRKAQLCVKIKFFVDELLDEVLECLDSHGLLLRKFEFPVGGEIE